MAHELKYSPLTLMFKYFAISDMFVFEESTKNILNTFENMLESELVKGFFQIERLTENHTKMAKTSIKHKPR